MIDKFSGELTLSDVFPWLKRAHPGVGATRIHPASPRANAPKVVLAITSLYRDTPLRELVGVPHEGRPLHETTIGRRAYNALTGIGVTTVADLLDISASTIRALPHVGATATTDAVSTLVDEAIDWFLQTGKLPATLMWEPKAPLTAVETLADVIGFTDSRRAEIFRRRFLISPPDTLQKIGDDFDVSRERVRQLESELLRALQRNIHSTPALASLDEKMAELACPFLPIADLLELHPEAAEIVPPIDTPVWKVLAAVSGRYSADDGWLAASSVAAAAEATRDAVETVPGTSMTVPVSALEFSSDNVDRDRWNEIVREWLCYNRLTVLDDGATVSRRPISNLPDYTVMILESTGAPHTSDEIMADYPNGAASVRSLRNVLSTDPRVMRVRPDTWGMASWPMEEFTTILDLIQRRLDMNGGQVQLSSLEKELPTSFGVSPASVATYARTAPFTVVKGMVQRGNGGTSYKKVSDLKNVYRRGDQLLYRTTVTKDHVRGSGSSLSTILVRELGVTQDASRSSRRIPSRLGSQSIRWSNVGSIGTVRRFLNELGLTEGDTMFLVFTGLDDFDVESVRPLTGDPAADIAALIGSTGTTVPEEAIRACASAIGLPAGASGKQVLDALWARGDKELANLVSQISGGLPGSER